MATLKEIQDIQLENARISSIYLNRVCCVRDDYTGSVVYNKEDMGCSYCVTVKVEKRTLGAGCFDSRAEAVKRITEIKKRLD